MALAFVRHSDGGTVDNGSTVVVTAAQTLTAGNLLVVGVRSSVSIVSCSDTAGNTFTALTQIGGDGENPIRIFYVANCLGHASNVVTVVSNNWYKAISADEFSGAALASVFDAEAGALHVSGTTLSSSNLTTTNANDLVVVYATQGGGYPVYSVGSGYTLIDGTMGVPGEDYFGAEYKIVSSTISGVAQTIVSTLSSAGTIAVAAFKEAVVASRVMRASVMPAAVHRASNF